MQLPEVIYGNEAQKAALVRAVMQDTLCHAYLFYGEEGIGKKTLALWFARMILCQHPTENGGCGVCHACVEFAQDTHPDLYVAPYDKPLPVAAVREIRARCFVKPNEGRYNVIVIPQADRMESASFNALLKVLEEPPGNTVFLLTAADKSSTPPTITSRCIPVMLSLLPEETLRKALHERTNADESLIEQAVSYADGNLGKALSMLEDASYGKAVQTASAMYEALCQRKEYTFLMLCQTQIADKAQFGRVNEVLLLRLRKELLSGGKISGLKQQSLLGMLEFCRETALRLRKPYSMQLLTAGYAAGIFAQIE